MHNEEAWARCYFAAINGLKAHGYDRAVAKEEACLMSDEFLKEFKKRKNDKSFEESEGGYRGR